MRRNLHACLSIRALCALILPAAALFLAPVVTSFGYQANPAWIAYMRDGDIWVMDASGNHQTPLNLQGDCYSPTWSPDRNWIAFLSRRNRRNNLFKVRVTINGNTATASSEVQLTNDSSGKAGAEWSPATTGPMANKILFHADPTGQFRIYAVDAETPVTVPQAALTESGGWGSWSPTADYIAFAGPEIPGGAGGNGFDIWMKPVTSSGPAYPVWDNESLVLNLEWSPMVGGQSRIAFSASGEAGVRILSIDHSGSNPSVIGGESQLTASGGAPGFSPVLLRPDGVTPYLQVVFGTQRSNRLKTDIYKLDADTPEGAPGNPAVPLATSNQSEERPVWNR